MKDRLLSNSDKNIFLETNLKKNMIKLFSISNVM